MDRDFIDIPEAFRRAFEEEERSGGNGKGRGSGRSGGGRPWWSQRRVWLGGLLLILFLSFNWLVYTYTEWLWFSEMGYRDVWLTQWGAQVAAFVFFFVVASIFLLGNWRLAFRRARGSGGSPGLRPLELPGLRGMMTGLALFLAFLFASGGAGQWERLLQYVYRVPFGVADPIFNRDVSFYLFELPIYRFLQGWMMPLLVFTLLGTAVLYAANEWRAVQQGRWRPYNLPIFRQHVAALLALFFGLWALGYWFGMYELLYSRQGVVFGAAYTDINASLPALWAQLATMALLAAVFALNIFRLALRPLLAAAGLWLVVTILVAGLYPGLMQRYIVEPNELAVETPYIEHNIAFTQLGFGLHDVDIRSFGRTTQLTQRDLQDNEEILDNIRVWDYRPLLQTYTQLQALRPYYQFYDIDVDRYQINGGVRQVMLAARELNQDNLPGQAWVNQRLEFTHGYGVAMNPVDRVTRDGQPEFFIRDLPPESNIPITIERPEIYFGETMARPVYANSALPEFSYPRDQETIYTSYDGRGGVPVQNWLRRLAFAVRFGDSNLVLSNYITPETQVMYHRTVEERVRQIAPFLALDEDPYIVVADGRLFWIIDTYTLSNRFPYSTPLRGINYIRNSVKVVVDAYHGDVDFYISDPDDPIIRTYARAFPTLFRSMEEFPEYLRPHLRYPEDLFTIQTQQYLVYHMTNVQVFYNREDLWEIPMELFDTDQQPIEPYYVLFRLPGEAEAEYLLIQPYAPANRNNMVAWIAARNDPEHYGQLVVYELPRQELVYGPIQIEARIDQDAFISQQLSLWGQRGSRVIRGNLIVIPINQSFLYVEPLYLQADTSGLPELRRVIVASGEHLVMRETLAEALLALVTDAPAVDVLVAEPPLEGIVVDPEVPAVPVLPPTAVDASVEELIQSANARFEAAEAAQRRGDWTAYGRELEALRQDLQRLMDIANQ
jgi:uncharacterized protein